MFRFSYFIVFIWIGSVAQVKAECTLAQNEKIGNCYESNFFQHYHIKDTQDLKNVFKQLFLNKENLGAVCKTKKSLDSCINDPEARECFNLRNFMIISSDKKSNNPIAKNNVTAKALLTNYLQLDYLCGKFEIAYENHENIFNAIHYCQNRYLLGSCDNANRMIEDCGVKKVNETSGQAASCYVKKFFSLELCLYQLNIKHCGICDKLSTNPNPIDSLCTDDDVTNVNESSSQTGHIINLSLMFTVFIAHVLS